VAIVKVAQRAGISLAEADVLRKAVGKKDADLIREELGKFVEKSVARGYSRNVSVITEHVRARLARPQRAPGDWSIELPAGGCTCDLCDTLRVFLEDPNQCAFEWPLAPTPSPRRGGVRGCCRAGAEGWCQR